ncbi:MAG TPA: hypothetical protein VFH51_05470, partial [Myxococcota bacterium]|nr:hypothetical protein [Myxococcota bacterium]
LGTLALALALGVGGGCSAAIDWDLARLTCGGPTNPNGCLPGYSCLEGHCAADRSLERGLGCTDVRQCQTGLVCPQAALDRPCREDDRSCLTCAAACDLGSAYTQGDCGVGQYCQAYCASALRPTATGYAACETGLRQAACTAGDACEAGAACTLPGSDTAAVCVPMERNIHACLQACAVSFASGAYGDGCGGTTDSPQVCTPLGMQGSQQLVCISLGTTVPQVAGGPCNGVAQPCAPGHACVAGFCRQYCDTTSATPCKVTGQSCAKFSGLGAPLPGSSTATVGYCAP